MPNIQIDINKNGTTTLLTKDKICTENIDINIDVNAASGGAPIEVATASEMNDLLIAANVGKIYKFTGTTDSNYTNGDLYEVESA